MLITSCGPAATAMPIEVTALLQEHLWLKWSPPLLSLKAAIPFLLLYHWILKPWITQSPPPKPWQAFWNNSFWRAGLFRSIRNSPRPVAESWEVSTDQRKSPFTCARCQFHDGTDFNADAVKFQFDRIMDPATASPALAYIPNLTNVDVVDPYTVKFTFSKPEADFWIILTYAYFGFNSPTAVKAAGDQYGRHPVGTGPFMFDSWIPGSQITLVRYLGTSSGVGMRSIKVLPWRKK